MLINIVFIPNCYQGLCQSGLGGVSRDRILEKKVIKYVSPDNGNCNIAEMALFDRGQKPVTGKVIGKYPGKTEEYGKVFDGNKLSYYNSAFNGGDWVGLDLGSTRVVKYIVYVPRTDLNTIEPGNTYELFVWHDKNWKSLGRQQATGYNLVYQNAPAGGLYWLRNLTTGNEERIFTYENGKQVWW